MKLLTVVGGRINGPSPVLVVEATAFVAVMTFATDGAGGTAGGGPPVSTSVAIFC